MAGGLRRIGVQKGDRVALFLPMIAEAAIALLACAEIGAIVVPIFSGYASDVSAQRLRDAGARVVISAATATRRGRSFPLHAIADEAVAQSPRDVRFVTDLPRTRSGKLMRRLVRASYLGHDPGDLSSVENMAAVDAIEAAS